MKLALVIEYEGTQYSGFQYQDNAPSIQEELEKAITKLTGEELRVAGAGRTDAGVHAEGQVVAFETSSRYSPVVFQKALNHYLPEKKSLFSNYLFDETKLRNHIKYRLLDLNHYQLSID